MISVSGLSYCYPNNPEQLILHDVCLDVPEGQTLAIMGANGSGKTTFVRCLNGLLLPVRGEVCVDGLKTACKDDLMEVRRRVGMVFQNPENQIVSTTVEREIAFGLENLGVPVAEMRRIVTEILDTFRLTDYRTHPPHLLSGGELQRLALASVIAMSPKYIVFDESTSLLDPKARLDTLALVIGLAGRGLEATAPITPLWVTQFAEETLWFERLIVFSRGKIVFDNKPHVVFESVEALQEFGLDVPVEYEINHHVKKVSCSKLSFNPLEILPIK
jgi:energy-coupling factor transport system ATP-binding protein